jgi:hypothetical protein
MTHNQAGRRKKERKGSTMVGAGASALSTPPASTHSPFSSLIFSRSTSLVIITHAGEKLQFLWTQSTAGTVLMSGLSAAGKRRKLRSSKRSPWYLESIYWQSSQVKHIDSRRHSALNVHGIVHAKPTLGNGEKITIFNYIVWIECVINAMGR